MTLTDLELDGCLRLTKTEDTEEDDEDRVYDHIYIYIVERHAHRGKLNTKINKKLYIFEVDFTIFGNVAVLLI